MDHVKHIGRALTYCTPNERFCFGIAQTTIELSLFRYIVIPAGEPEDNCSDWHCSAVRGELNFI
jgi:hypothetical protein